MYKYETHLHTYPVSQCGEASVRETLEFYKSIGYKGIFITNHFLDANINIEYRERSYEEQIEFFFSDYEEAKKISGEIGIDVFCGVEMSYKGTDFLVYGLDKEWYLKHPEIMDMQKSEELPFLAENGGFIVHAHPYRQASYIDHIRLFPACIQGVETINANRTDLENKMADLYADNYGFLKTAGSDNHSAGGQRHLAGLSCETPVKDEIDFINKIKNGEMSIFEINV